MDAKPVAGGTALLAIIKQGLLLPGSLVNLKKIRDGAAISFDPHCLGGFYFSSRISAFALALSSGVTPESHAACGVP